MPLSSESCSYPDNEPEHPSNYLYKYNAASSLSVRLPKKRDFDEKYGSIYEDDCPPDLNSRRRKASSSGQKHKAEVRDRKERQAARVGEEEIDPILVKRARTAVADEVHGVSSERFGVSSHSWMVMKEMKRYR